MTEHRTHAAVALLTLLLAVLLAVQTRGSLLGDELATAYDVSRGGLGDVIALLRDGSPVSNEFSPPLYFTLAWLADRLGDGTQWIRLPSALAALALVPAVYALGRSAFGPRAGLVAAGLWALAPFAGFYGSEARPYALLALLSALCTLALLSALRDGGTRRWALYAVATAAILYTHYTGAGVVLAHAGWALATADGRRREVLAANAAALVLYLPWLPFVRKDETVEIYQALGPRTLEGYLVQVAHAFPGHPFLPLDTVPGIAPLALLLVAAVASAAWALVRAERRRPGSPAGLLAVVALATPAAIVGLALTSGDGAFLARSLAASLPATLVLLGAAIAALPRTPAILAGAATLGVLALGSLQQARPEHRRPDYAGLAAYVDATAGPRDPVLTLTLFSPTTSASRFMTVHFRRPHDERVIPLGDEAAWTSPQLRARRLFAVVPRGTSLAYLRRPPGPPGRYALTQRRPGDGLGAPEVRVYALASGSRPSQVPVAP